MALAVRLHRQDFGNAFFHLYTRRVNEHQPACAQLVEQQRQGGVAELRAKGMKVIDNVDKAKFVAALAPVNAGFEKDFGKANLDRIRNVK